MAAGLTNTAECCGPPRPLLNSTGADTASIACYTPDGCGCGPDPCAISLEDFICAVRQLLPEGEPYRPSKAPGTTPVQNSGATVICDDTPNLVGSPGCAGEQLVLGGCCGDDGPVACVEEETAPQLAVIDSFAAVLYGFVQALCKALCELDPCCAKDTLERWAERLGIIRTDAVGCPQPFPKPVLAFLVCLYVRLKNAVFNLAMLESLAKLFGAKVELQYAGALNCDYYRSYWHMARDFDLTCHDKGPAGCGPVNPLPKRILRFDPCEGRKPESINVIVCPDERVFPPNCNLYATPPTHPHDPDMYEAFLWLLPRILPKPVRWCVYGCDDMACESRPQLVITSPAAFSVPEGTT